MSGSLLQLKSFGNVDQYLYKDPEMSFYMAGYERPTRSAQEMKTIIMDGPNELSEDKSITLRAIIPKEADLIGNLYFSFHLPDIYSSYNPDVIASQPDKAAYKFQWIRNIGTNIIRNAKASLNGKLISSTDGEWIKLWHELFSDVDRVTFDHMTGNLPELYAPEYSVQAAGMYPTSSLNPQQNVDPDLFTLSDFLKNPYNKGPSIIGDQYIIPLNFFFSQKHSGLYLPLIALQYEELQIELELRPLIELYTIIDNSDENSETFGQRVRPNPFIKHHNIQNFITSTPKESFIYGENYHEIHQKYRGINFQPSLLINYISLDREERTKIAAESLTYMVEQVEKIEFTGVFPGRTHTFDLRIQHPVKAILFFAKRDDLEEKNIFDIYLNHVSPPIHPGSLLYLRQHSDETETFHNVDSNNNSFLDIVDLADRAKMNNVIMDKFNQSFFNRNIIKSFKLLLDGKERFEENSSKVFEYLQNYQHGIKNHIEGVLKYSFALDMTDYQHSSTCNMSSFHQIQAQLGFAEAPFEDSSNGNKNYKYHYNVTFYIIRYNNFVVNSGEGSMQFV